MLINFDEISEIKNPRYQEYLHSQEWKNIREEILERDGHKCKLCGSTENLRVHHKSYECLYEEECAMQDLITLCEKCHGELHDFLNSEVAQKTKKAIYELRQEYYEKLKNDIQQIIIDNFGKPLLEKNKKHIVLYTYLSSFWGINFYDISPIYFYFSGQNAYCEIKKRGLIK